MEIMGWSNASMAKRYQNVTTRLHASIADQLDDFPLASGRAPRGKQPPPK